MQISSNQLRGRECEQIAEIHYLQKGYSLIHQRFKSPFAEIDLVLRSPKGVITLLEVKSLKSFDYIESRLRAGQKKRLLRAYRYYCEKESRVEMHLVFVNSDNQVLVFEDLFSC